MSLLSLPEAELRRRSSMKWCTYEPDVLPMWVAEMDVAMQPTVRAALLAAIENSDTGYPYGRGYANAFAAMAQQRWGLELDADRQIRQAGDVMNNILTVLNMVTAPGDAVIINPPIYPPFRQVTEGYGRKIVEVGLTEAGRLDLPAILQAIAEGPAAYLLCSPHNPNGTVHTRDELATIAQACQEYGVQLIVDEIHACLVDPGTEFVSVLSVPGGEAAVVSTSAGKAWNLAGFKAGLIVGGLASGRIIDAIPPVSLGSMGHLAAIAHTTAMREEQDWIDQLVVELQANKALLAALLADRLPQVKYQPGAGTYLAWLDCSELGMASPADSFHRIGRVAFSPGKGFAASHNQWVRVNLAASPAFVEQAVERMVRTLG